MVSDRSGYHTRGGNVGKRFKFFFSGGKNKQTKEQTKDGMLQNHMTEEKLMATHQATVGVHQLRHVVYLSRQALVAIYDALRRCDDAEFVREAASRVALAVEANDPLVLADF